MSAKRLKVISLEYMLLESIFAHIILGKSVTYSIINFLLCCMTQEKDVLCVDPKRVAISGRVCLFGRCIHSFVFVSIIVC